MKNISFLAVLKLYGKYSFATTKEIETMRKRLPKTDFIDINIT